jgi:hypothetical protein
VFLAPQVRSSPFQPSPDARRALDVLLFGAVERDESGFATVAHTLDRRLPELADHYPERGDVRPAVLEPNIVSIERLLNQGAGIERAKLRLPRSGGARFAPQAATTPENRMGPGRRAFPDSSSSPLP